MKKPIVKNCLKSGFVVAAASSGSGKTTFTIGLLRALRQRGLNVSPFKCGPDYIDTQFHRVASGRESVNLDMYMGTERHVKDVYCRYGALGDVSVVEGVMGLFDGYDNMKGSTADVAVALGLPVVLVVNSASTAYSVGALIYGFKHFNPQVEILGAVFNKVASDSHFAMLERACIDAGVECLGYVKRMPGLEVPSRHLGLTIDNARKMDEFAELAAEAVASTVNVDRLLEISARPFQPVESDCDKSPSRSPLTVAMAHDDAFNFVYAENIAALKRNARYDVSIVEFSPIHDAALPDADIVYLPGGYPEMYAEQLEANAAMRSDIKRFAESGGRILAECGGLLYISDSIDGKRMCGVMPFECTMNQARLTLGYRLVHIVGFPEIRGHEFHYSKLVNPDALASVAEQYNAKGQKVSTALYRHKNVFAGYTHLYWGETDILKLWNL